MALREAVREGKFASVERLFEVIQDQKSRREMISSSRNKLLEVAQEKGCVEFLKATFCKFGVVDFAENQGVAEDLSGGKTFVIRSRKEIRNALKARMRKREIKDEVVLDASVQSLTSEVPSLKLEVPSSSKKLLGSKEKGATRSFK